MKIFIPYIIGTVLCIEDLLQCLWYLVLTLAFDFNLIIGNFRLGTSFNFSGIGGHATCLYVVNQYRGSRISTYYCLYEVVSLNQFNIEVRCNVHSISNNTINPLLLYNCRRWGDLLYRWICEVVT